MSQSNDDPMRDLVQSVLKSRGLHADPIPETSINKTPDLVLLVPAGRILIEVECKEDDGQLRRLVESPARTTYSYKTSSIESLLRHAWHQIYEFPERCEDDFNIVWLVASRPGLTAFTRPAAMSVLYGIEYMDGQFEASGEYYERECFFFGYSFLFRRQKLDGVVLHDDSQITLCLNPRSNRLDDFKRTSFVQLFKREFEVIDPEEQERSGECFLADCSLPRRDYNGVVRYLKMKYGLATVNLYRFVLINFPVA